jgi:HAD superfamily hydrolase (TIGR01509 family)
MALEREIMNRKFNWIFFDLDGTLADSIPAMYQVYIGFLNKFGINGTKEEFEELNGPSLSEIVDILRTRHRLDSDKYFLIDLYKSKILDAYKNYVKPIDGANDILQELKNRGYKLLLVTSADQEIALEFIKCQKWDRYFQYHVFGNEIKKAKPDPKIYGLALKKANTSSKSVAVIEDSPHGIKSAKSLGVFVIGLANNCSKEELLGTGANIVIYQLKEILSILEVKE